MRKKGLILLSTSVVILITIGVLLIGFLPGKLRFLPTFGKSPVLDFPLENPEAICAIRGRDVDPNIRCPYSGIYFFVNESTPIIAPCDLKVGIVDIFWVDDNITFGHWETRIVLKHNMKYYLSVEFSSPPPNNEQLLLRGATCYWSGEEILQGDILGELFYYGEGAYLNLQMTEDFKIVRPYPFFSSDAKNLFDELWEQFGTDTGSCRNLSEIAIVCYYIVMVRRFFFKE